MNSLIINKYNKCYNKYDHHVSKSLLVLDFFIVKQYKLLIIQIYKKVKEMKKGPHAVEKDVKMRKACGWGEDKAGHAQTETAEEGQAKL